MVGEITLWMTAFFVPSLSISPSSFSRRSWSSLISSISVSLKVHLNIFARWLSGIAMAICIEKAVSASVNSPSPNSFPRNP